MDWLGVRKISGVNCSAVAVLVILFGGEESWQRWECLSFSPSLHLSQPLSSISSSCQRWYVGTVFDTGNSRASISISASACPHQYCILSNSVASGLHKTWTPAIYRGIPPGPCPFLHCPELHRIPSPWMMMAVECHVHRHPAITSVSARMGCWEEGPELQYHPVLFQCGNCWERWSSSLVLAVPVLTSLTFPNTLPQPNAALISGLSTSPQAP